MLKNGAMHASVAMQECILHYTPDQGQPHPGRGCVVRGGAGDTYGIVRADESPGVIISPAA